MNKMKLSEKPKTYVIELTQAEIKALTATAGQMSDDMDYYNFMGKKRSANFREAYETAMTKLQAKIK